MFMSRTTAAAFLTCAIITAPATADTTSPPAPVLVKANPGDTFAMTDFPWHLPEGRTEDVRLALGKGVLTMPWMEVTKSGKDNVTITGPELSIGDRDKTDNGGLRASDVSMQFRREDDTMFGSGLFGQVGIEMGGDVNSPGSIQLGDVEFTMTASDYDLAVEALEAGAPSGSEDMQAAMRALNLALDYGMASGKLSVMDDSEGVAFDLDVGPSTTALVFGDGRFSMETTGTKTAFAMTRPVPAEASIGRISYGFDLPTDKTDDPQPLSFGMEIGDVTVAGGIWDMMDPKAIFPRELDRFEADVTLDVLLNESMFDREARIERKLRGGDALDAVGISINSFTVDALGLDVAAKGELAMADKKPEAIDAFLSVAGLSGFMANIVKAGLVPEPQAIMVEGMAMQFGEEKDDGTLTFDITTRENMLVINDNPVAPLPK